MSSALTESLFITLQRLLPARAIGRLVHALARVRTPVIRDLLIHGFVRLYDIDTTEAGRPVPAGYESFNAFFTRELRAGARPVDEDPASVISPADGRIQQIGTIEGEEILQVKGISYRVGELLGGEPQDALRYRNGSFITIYLAPWNYHRVHMPVAARITGMRHLPGDLWSVNAVTAARVARLFARNERLVCHGEAPWGNFAIVLVGALNVGSISTAWAGEVLPRRARQMTEWRYGAGHPGTDLARAATLGQFNLGSTVVVLFPQGTVRWRPGLTAGAEVRVGMALGQLERPRP